MVTRLNTRIGIPDYVFAVIDNSVSQMVGRLKWLPLLVLCSKLCPPGIEGTFYALLMSIQNAGLLMSGWWVAWCCTCWMWLERSSVTSGLPSWSETCRGCSRWCCCFCSQSDQNSMLLPQRCFRTMNLLKLGKEVKTLLNFSVLVADDSSCHALNVAVKMKESKWSMLNGYCGVDSSHERATRPWSWLTSSWTGYLSSIHDSFYTKLPMAFWFCSPLFGRLVLYVSSATAHQ